LKLFKNFSLMLQSFVVKLSIASKLSKLLEVDYEFGFGRILLDESAVATGHFYIKYRNLFQNKMGSANG